MIEINLLNETPKIRFNAKGNGLGSKIETFLGLIPFIIAALLALHFLLGIISLLKGRQLAVLSKKWKTAETERKALEDLKKEYSLLTEDALAIQQLTNQRVTWAKKLNKISLELPQGLWLTEVSVSAGEFLLSGSVVSMQTDEVALINKLIDSLKNSAEFSSDLSSLELSSVQRKTVGELTVADFLLAGTLSKQAGKIK